MKNKIVDSHCHLDFDDFSNDLDEVINNARINNVEFMLSISVDLEKFEKIHKIIRNHNNIWCSTGVHPNNVPTKFRNDEISKLKEKLKINLSKDKVIGIGETGLDYFRNLSNRDNQLDYFEAHMEVSGKSCAPLITHTRNAENDTIEHLNKYVKKYMTKGLIHCFTSTKKLARCALNNGFYISFSGIITFEKTNKLKEVVEYTPLDRILVETDSPYLSPVPFRGKRNEPSKTRYTLEKIAELKKIDFEQAAKITTDNFFRLFTNAKNGI